MNLRNWQIWRSISSLGDEMWLTVLPIALAGFGYSAAQVGLIFSAGAVGSLLGFIFVPVLTSWRKAAHVALGTDVFQFIIYLTIILILISPLKFNLPFWMTIHFAVCICDSIWFGSSETLISRITDSTNSQSAHKWNYFASSLGPAAGPALSGVLYSALGILPILAVNAFSFLGQAFTLMKIGRSEYSAPAVQKIRPFKPLADGAHLIFKDARLTGLTLVPLTVKVTLLGALPFLTFVLSKDNVSPILIGLLLTAFSVGNLIGAFSYNSSDPTQLSKFFRRDASMLLVFIAALNSLLFMKPNFYYLAPVVFLAGYFVARYSIELRSMRQLVVDHKHMAAVISAQSIMARLLTPLSGILFGFLLSIEPGLLHLLSIGGLLAVGALGILKTSIAYSPGDRA